MTKLLFALVCVLMLVACGPKRNLRITDLFESKIEPDYSLTEMTKLPNTGFNIGLLVPEWSVSQETMGKMQTSNTISESDRPFISAIMTTLEKALLSKGCTVSGPFKSYSEMTFPERQRCTYLIQLKITITSKYSTGNVQHLKDHGGPNFEPYAYASVDMLWNGTAEIEYIIYEPLTFQILEKHKITSSNLNVTGKSIMQGKYIDFDQYGKVIYNQYEEPGSLIKLLGDTSKNISSWTPLHQMTAFQYQGYFNQSNFVAKVGDAIFKDLRMKIVNRVSVEEFTRLKEYKDVLEKKKSY